MRFALSITCWFLTCLDLLGQPAAAEEGAVHSLMQQLSTELRAAQSAWQDGEALLVAAPARSLAALAPATRRVEPLAALEHRGEVARWAEELEARSAALAALSATADPRLFAEHFDGISRACTGCHLQFRTDNHDRGLFPMAGNAIFGRVDVQKLDGAARDDCSDLVVFLDRVPGDWQPPLSRPRISQKDRVFRPTVLAVVKGTQVEFPNDDLVFHNVFSLSKAQPFDLGLYAAGSSKAVTFDATGLAKIYCNIHPDMLAHVLVLGNPFAAVTAPSGFFALTGVPDGEFLLRVWHEFGGDLAQKVEVQGGQALRVDLRIHESRKRLPHRDKHGRHYSSYR